MADIDIVPKHRSRVWLWIVIAIVIIAAIWIALARGNHATRTGALSVADPVVAQALIVPGTITG